MISELVQIEITPNKQSVALKKGQLDRNGQMVGSVYDVLIAPPMQLIPNEYTAYCKEVLVNGKYEGQLQFLKENETGGTMKTIRYLSTCHSLDKHYQERNNFNPNSDEEVIGKMFQGGTIINLPNNSKNRLYLEFLEHHPNNGGNLNKISDSAVYFKFVNGASDLQDELLEMKRESKTNELKADILNNQSKAELYAYIFKLDDKIAIETNQVILIKKIKNDPNEFIQTIDDFWNKVKNDIDYALLKEKIIIEDGTILDGDTKKAIYKDKSIKQEDKEGAVSLYLTSLNSLSHLKKWQNKNNTILN